MAQLRSSCEAKGKALLSATSEAAATSLSVLSSKVTAPSGANSEVTSLKGKTQYSSAKALSAQIASPLGEAMPSARKSAFKTKFRAKPKTFQPIWANLQPSLVSVLNRLGQVNIDLREFLSNK